jgi:hypothetical protein
VKRFLTALMLATIRAYQRWVSPGLPRRCKYEPTCSAYAAEAIRELGPIRGSIVAAWRLLRCNPFSHGGIDDLSDRTLFRGAPARGQRRHRARTQRVSDDPVELQRRTTAVSR